MKLKLPRGMEDKLARSGIAREQERGTTSDRIIAAALSRFAAQGYAATSLAEIAQDVGIRKPSIYAHFESKRQLFMQILAQARQIETECIARLGQGGVEGTLRAYINGIMERYKRDDYLLFWLRALYLPPCELAGEIRSVDREYVALMDAAIGRIMAQLAERDGHDLTDAVVLADAYCGIIRAIHAELLYHGPERTRAIADALWQIFDLALAA